MLLFQICNWIYFGVGRTSPIFSARFAPINYHREILQVKWAAASFCHDFPIFTAVFEQMKCTSNYHHDGVGIIMLLTEVSNEAELYFLCLRGTTCNRSLFTFLSLLPSHNHCIVFVVLLRLLILLRIAPKHSSFRAKAIGHPSSMQSQLCRHDPTQYNRMNVCPLEPLLRICQLLSTRLQLFTNIRRLGILKCNGHRIFTNVS